MTLEPAANRILGTRPNDDDSAFQFLGDGPNLLQRRRLFFGNFFGEGSRSSGFRQGRDRILPAAFPCGRKTARYRAVLASSS